MPQKDVTHAMKKQGMCYNFLGACAPYFRGICHNFLGHVPQFFGECATTFRSMCCMFLRHVPHILWHMFYILWHGAYWSLSWHVPPFVACTPYFKACGILITTAVAGITPLVG